MDSQMAESGAQQIDDICSSRRLDHPCAVAAALHQFAATKKAQEDRVQAIMAKLAEASKLAGQDVREASTAVGQLNTGHLDAAEAAADAALAKVQAAIAAEAARKKQAEDLAKAGTLCEVALTSPPPKACLDECTSTPTSLACYFVGEMHASGQKVHRDDAKARDYFQRGCSQSVELSCDGIAKLDQQAAQRLDQQKARAALPGLFAQCRQLRARILVSKAEVERAVQARDRNRLAALQPPFIALTQKWNEVAQQANFTIATAVGRGRMDDDQLFEP